MATKQKGCIVRISNRWYVRYWERRNIGGVVEQKRVSHCLGDVTTRGKHAPADVSDAAAEHLAGVNRAAIPADRITTIGQFVDGVYLPWVDENKRPSTAKGYRDIWEDHLKPLCATAWMKNTRTFHVQGWLNSIGRKELSRNSLKRIKSMLSGMFKHAKQQDYFDGVNPVMDTAVSASAAEAEETYAYSLEELNGILAHTPEPAATAFAIAAYTGLRIGEIEGLRWEDYRNGEIHVSRSIWNGHEGDPKTRKSRAPVPVIRHLAERLEMHRLRSLTPQSGPIFTTRKGTRQSMNNLRERSILPALNRCERCRKAEVDHARADHKYLRDAQLPEWHGWHSCRRGLGSNLNRLGVSDVVIQRILRHANVSTTMAFYVKSSSDDVRRAMTKLENSIPQAELDTIWTPGAVSAKPM
jgi:integrase